MRNILPGVEKGSKIASAGELAAAAETQPRSLSSRATSDIVLESSRLACLGRRAALTRDTHLIRPIEKTSFRSCLPRRVHCETWW